MTKQEATERFNSLPREIRTTIIGSEIVSEISHMKRERLHAVNAHKNNLKRIDERISTLEKSLANLKDD